MNDSIQKQKIVIVHIKGSNAGKKSEFSVEHFQEIEIGRDPNSDMIFDPNQDDLVSRKHAKIINEGGVFKIVDLDSQNGTFLDGQKVFEEAVIFSGARIQLGAGGAEFEFTLDPLPKNHVKPTRVEQSIPKPTRLQTAFSSDQPNFEAGLEDVDNMDGFGNGGSVGKETLIREVSKAKASNRRLILTVFSVFTILLVLGISYFNYNQKTIPVVTNPGETKPNYLSSEDIASKYRDAIVYINATWQLTTSNGTPLYHLYVSDRNNSYNPVPCYYLNENYEIYPFLVAEGSKIFTKYGSNVSVPISNKVSGTGFVITQKGHILTNRHIIAPWQNPISMSRFRAGRFVYLTKDGLEIDWEKVAYPSDFNNKWRPDDISPLRNVLSTSSIEGELRDCSVQFPGDKHHNRAEVLSIANEHDVAIVKIDVLKELTSVSLAEEDNYHLLQQGEDIFVMGYPSLSPGIVGFVVGKDAGGSKTRIIEIKMPSMSKGIVSKIIRGDNNSSTFEKILFKDADYIQLDMNVLGPGSSGGACFNKKGEVIGIYTGYYQDQVAAFPIAVPIKFAHELTQM